MSSTSPFALVTCSTGFVTLVFGLMMVVRILSFSLSFSIFLSIVRCLFQACLLMLLIETMFGIHMSAGKTHWLKIFLFLGGRRGGGGMPVQKDFFELSKNVLSCFYSYQNFLLCSVFHCYCLS